MIALLIWFIIISILSCIVTWNDKQAAKNNRRRVPEARLFTLALLGGAPAMLLTMKRIRHKTKHRRFMWGLPAIITLHAICIALALYFFKT
ncbi:MAG: DUF1294 domain-containing protein [Oscillospiraceae bacterium]|nr:DUF1294 domain-containing protein [Oscillospiraceae bacterium]